MTTLVLTVDAEEWAQSSWDRDRPVTDASARQCARLLELLADYPGSRATFFVLGKFAEAHPGVVADIRSAGHEVACHGYGHVEIFRMSRSEFAEDVRVSTDLVASATGVAPKGFRAPDFSIVAESLWALEVLCEAGYTYDSSIFPIRKARYGIEGWPPGATVVSLPSGGQIVELPLATVAAGARRLPIAGGGYARLLPGAALEVAFRRAAREVGEAPVFYCHPYELDTAELAGIQPPLPLKVRLHQGLGRGGTERKLRRLLSHGRAIAAEDAIGSAGELPVTDSASFAGQATGRPAIPGMKAPPSGGASGP